VASAGKLGDRRQIHATLLARTTRERHRYRGASGAHYLFAAVEYSAVC
jgi:hypothetical protein